jgi:hypothetical protein
LPLSKRLPPPVPRPLKKITNYLKATLAKRATVGPQKETAMMTPVPRPLCPLRYPASSPAPTNSPIESPNKHSTEPLAESPTDLLPQRLLVLLLLSRRLLPWFCFKKLVMSFGPDVTKSLSSHVHDVMKNDCAAFQYNT